MPKKIQAYFKTEDDALTVKIHLAAYDTAHLEIGEREGFGEVPQIVPVALGTRESGAFNTAPAGITDGALGALFFRETLAPRRIDPQYESVDRFKYVLSAEIMEEDYREVEKLIHGRHGRVDVLG